MIIKNFFFFLSHIIIYFLPNVKGNIWLIDFLNGKLYLISLLASILKNAGHSNDNLANNAGIEANNGSRALSLKNAEYIETVA